MVAWDKMNQDNYGYDWAIEMNTTFKKLIAEHRHAELIDYSKLGKAAMLSIPSPDHYIPLLYALGLQEDKDETSFFNDKLVAGSLNMTSVSISRKKLNLDPTPVSPQDSAKADSTNVG